MPADLLSVKDQTGKPHPYRWLATLQTPTCRIQVAGRTRNEAKAQGQHLAQRVTPAPTNTHAA